MKILIIGAGMYVTGRKETGPGIILSSLAETSKTERIDEVVVAAISPANRDVVTEAVSRINRTLGANLKARYEIVGGDGTDISRLCRREGFDCAIVAVPDHLHFSYTRALLEERIHCLVVKPFTPTYREARELVELQQHQGVYGAVEFHKRFDQTNLYIRRSLEKGTLGKLLYFTIDYSQKISIPLETFRGWSHKTNIFQYLGVHYVDLIYFLTGYCPVRVMAIGIDGVLKQQGIDTFDSVHAHVLWENPTDRGDRFLSQFTTNWIDPVCTSAMSDQKYKVIGIKGRIECDQKNRGVELVHETEGIQQINPYFSEYLPDENGQLRFGGYGHESIRLFLRDVLAIGNGSVGVKELESCRPTFQQSLVSSAVVDAVNLSLADNFSWREINAIFPE